MDDKILNLELPWATIRDTSERGISEYILKQMKGARDVPTEMTIADFDKRRCQRRRLNARSMTMILLW